MKDTRFTVGHQLAVLAVVIAIVYAPTVRSGRLLDDVIVLDKCEKLPWSALLTEGFKFERIELGNVWWIDQETIMCYFRPLLLATLRAATMLPGSGDGLQRAINLALHFAAAGLLLAYSRRILTSPRSAFLATLFFAVCFHPRWAILLITARKELLVGVFVLLALYLHTRGHWKWAAASFAGALLSGEHAVAFPLIVLCCDVLAPGRRDRTEGAFATARRAWPSWAGYLGVLAVYTCVRILVLDGIPLPVPPYLNTPATPGFASYLLLRPLILLFSLTTGVPFVDRPIIEIWFNHQAGFAGSVLVVAGVLGLLFAASRDRRLCLTFLVLAVVAYLPFLPLAAIPFYLYTPCIFYALAIGAALDGTSLGSPKGRAAHRRLFTAIVGAAILVNFVVGVVLSWGPSRPPFSPGINSPQRVAEAVARLLEDKPVDRKVIFVDAPPPPPFFYFVYELSRISGRDPADLAVVTCQHRRTDAQEPKITVHDQGQILLESPERPYFANTVKKLLWCFPDGLIAEGRTFERDWLTVTIAATSDTTRSRPRHFFSREPGIASLLLRVQPDAAPLVIGFQEQEPVILFDLDATIRE